MNFLPTEIPEVMILEPRIFQDKRGFFIETYKQEVFKKNGIQFNFVQDNHSGSQAGVLRGLHYQLRYPQGKLLRVVKGEIFDVAVDLRRSSQSFGNWVGGYLSDENKRQMWIPPGFAHGFYVLSAWAELFYKATDYYSPEWERTILWNDPLLGIEWPITKEKPLLISDKDLQGCKFLEAEVYA